jgi:hypothetical protein
VLSRHTLIMFAKPLSLSLSFTRDRIFFFICQTSSSSSPSSLIPLTVSGMHWVNLPILSWSDDVKH